MDVFDLLFDLLGLVFAIFGKFGTVILVALGYLFFGKNRKKPKNSRRPIPRPVFTPVFTPSAGQGGTYEPSQTYTPDTPLDENLDNPFTPSQEVSTESSEVMSVSAERFHEIESKETTQERSTQKLDPREAMKWSIIFSPPRSKQPYSPGRRQ
ncbi:hypothetical protein ACQCN2_03415 [Brevibacillus ginsengisoli]|uniref:hypothetical protein n=1 Tax=Brevibacillus ginsengisoli TaxID=363854 RepID=UPI003CF8AF1E